ncbi:MAG TPA: 5-(carboxyamino)imidazole ribonucleotide synthase [Gammaproteobacteria bacterium]|nr:5-(carboxyamino)imidazole ribonucleotide synthase [Gammaproteobacteria bacterium]
MIIGIVGGGQLARMLALAGHPLGLKFAFLDPAPDACAASLGTHFCADYRDRAALQRLADAAHVVTFEFENVPAATMAVLAERVPAYPPAPALATAQDRLAEKTCFTGLGIPTPRYRAVDSLEGLMAAVDDLGLPAVLKTRTLGYDGKGQAVLRERGELAGAWARLAGVPCLLEEQVPFERELSLIAVRGRGGDTAFYPLTENVHRDGILRLSQCRPGHPLQARAESHGTALLDALDYVGVLALELFQVGGRLLANEIAPRVHNTGHWTIEGALTSQFENHLRAILGFPLGATAAVAPAAMVNLIGEPPDIARLLAIPGARVHLYGKEARPGRKLGHVTVSLAEPAAQERVLQQVLDLVGP